MLMILAGGHSIDARLGERFLLGFGVSQLGELLHPESLCWRPENSAGPKSDCVLLKGTHAPQATLMLRVSNEVATNDIRGHV